MEKKYKILTVDDEVGIVSFLYDFFSVRGFDVLQAANGPDAIKIVERQRPSIVLLDVKMGRGMSGIEVLKKIKEIDKGIKVIMMTGVKDDEIVEEALALGASDYITKPLSLAYLDKVVMLKVLNLQIHDMVNPESAD